MNMNILKAGLEYLVSLSLTKKLIISALIVGIGWFSFSRISGNKTAEPEYQTAPAEKGTLITNVSASGSVGPNLETQQQTAASWASYLSAKNNLDSTKANLNTLQSDLFEVNQKFINDAVARELETNDPTYIQQNADWLAAEAKYINQKGVISQAQAAMNSAWLSYKQNSSTVVPSEKHVVVNLTETDVIKVKPGQKVTLKLNAHPDKTFTGKVLSINTSGSVSSGVTTYPATITFDNATDDIYSNMAANAAIITQVKNNVILVPSSAIQTSSASSTVRVMKGDQVTSVQVEVGNSNDTQTEILSGINEGEIVITGQANITTPGSTGATSPFGSTRGGFGGGSQMLIRR